MASETETVTKNVGKRYDEAEMFRHFHDGPLLRCPDCGRMVFQPCLACWTERKGEPVDPADGIDEPVEILCVQLQDDERQRYEEIHLDKVLAAIKRDRCGEIRIDSENKKSTREIHE